MPVTTKIKQSKSYHFTKEVVLERYQSYAKTVFIFTIQTLLKCRNITKTEQNILSLSQKHALSKTPLYTHSSIIYLSNGILRNQQSNDQTVRHQWFLEVAIRLLAFGIVEKIDYQSQGGFSLFLNQNINNPFDSIAKKDNDYLFFCDGGKTSSLTKNLSLMISPGVDFLSEDHNPFNTESNHPDVQFNSYDLGGKTREQWVTQFVNAYQIIKEYTNDIYTYISPFLDQLAPLGFHTNLQISTSFSASPGILYLSYTNCDLTQAEALIHETSHTIYNIIEKKENFILNERIEQYYSSYRPDARPLQGCFLGLHAFVAVQHFYFKLSQVDQNQYNIFLKLFLKNRIQIQVLDKYASFSPEGKLLYLDVKKQFAQSIPFYKNLRPTEPELVKKIKMEVSAHLKKAESDNEILLH